MFIKYIFVGRFNNNSIFYGCEYMLYYRCRVIRLWVDI